MISRKLSVITPLHFIDGNYIMMFLPIIIPSHE